MSVSLYNDTFNDSDLGHEDFKKVIEDHLPVLTANSTKTMTILPVDAERYEYDFYGVLRTNDISPRYHWVIMRVNGMMASNEYRKNMLEIRIPNFDEIEMLFNYYSTFVKRSSS